MYTHTYIQSHWQTTTEKKRKKEKLKKENELEKVKSNFFLMGICKEEL